MKAIIMCAGKGRRWMWHKPKQLSLVKGVPNLLRTHSMLYELGIKDIWITVNPDNKKYFEPYNLDMIIGDYKRETQRYSNAFPLTEETLYLYGDVIYAEDDLRLIVKPVEPRQVTTWFGRIGPNKLTGKNHGELMGVHIIDTKRFEDATIECERQFKERERKMCIG